VVQNGKVDRVRKHFKVRWRVHSEGFCEAGGMLPWAEFYASAAGLKLVTWKRGNKISRSIISGPATVIDANSHLSQNAVQNFMKQIAGIMNRRARSHQAICNMSLLVHFHCFIYFHMLISDLLLSASSINFPMAQHRVDIQRAGLHIHLHPTSFRLCSPCQVLTVFPSLSRPQKPAISGHVHGPLCSTV
jgi:hypothetical protein